MGIIHREHWGPIWWQHFSTKSIILGSTAGDGFWPFLDWVWQRWWLSSGGLQRGRFSGCRLQRESGAFDGRLQLQGSGSPDPRARWQHPGSASLRGEKPADHCQLWSQHQVETDRKLAQGNTISYCKQHVLNIVFILFLHCWEHIQRILFVQRVLVKMEAYCLGSDEVAYFMLAPVCL